MSKPYNPNDFLAQKARAENYRARSVYKLEELDQKYYLVKPNMHILDVGAAPGSWLQYVSEKIGQNGQVVGIDLQEIDPVSPNVQTFVADITDVAAVQKVLQTVGWDKVDLLLSDIAPSTSGITDIDHGRSLDLNRAIVALAKQILKPGKKLVLKVFEGRDFANFVKELRRDFDHVEVTKSHASRERSKEKYIICFS
ncbi:MAG TPA: RlmE family RNA methyltransferase [Candidatus Saccharimonadales bacterium]|nr:RlmE family RNA methyltransferase [Candidatus Saccharimonadales bacterium]